MSQNYDMNPGDIAENISTNEDRCPACGSNMAANIDDQTLCPHQQCENFNQEYRTGLIDVWLSGKPVSGVKDYNTLEIWIKLNFPKHNPPDVIATNLSYWLAKEVKDKTKELAQTYMYGHVGFKDNIEDMNIELKQIHAKDLMFEFMESFGYVDYAEEEGTERTR